MQFACNMHNHVPGSSSAITHFFEVVKYFSNVSVHGALSPSIKVLMQNIGRKSEKSYEEKVEKVSVLGPKNCF